MQTGSYIDGQWFHPDSERIIRNINPADTNEVIAEFPAATISDTPTRYRCGTGSLQRLEANAWPGARARTLAGGHIARERTDEIAELMTREEGKIFREAKGEVLKGISLLEFYSGEGYRMHGKTMPSENRNSFTYTIRRPLGAVGLISPWNFPWAIPVWKSAPAIVAGNTVVFKPAVLTPGTATLFG